jgi:hypothetical protein
MASKTPDRAVEFLLALKVEFWPVAAHGVQVKALSKRAPVPLGNTLDKIMGDFWVIVNRVASATPSAFVLSRRVHKKPTPGGKQRAELCRQRRP